MSGSIRLLTTLLILVLVTSACTSISASEPTATPEPPDKILFVGNHLTSYNQGLEHHIEQLAGSTNPPLVIEADSIVRDGASLAVMWRITKARELIGEGDYDVVVLQDDIVLTDVETFNEYARRFVAEIKEVGTEPVLLMAWEMEYAGRQIPMDEIAKAHFDIAMELGIDVAPVGLAWQRAMEERPDLDLLSEGAEIEGTLPTIHGTYLAINVVYATVFGESPIGLAYLPSWRGGVTEEEAAFLQSVAWETVQEYQAQQ